MSDALLERRDELSRQLERQREEIRRTAAARDAVIARRDELGATRDFLLERIETLAGLLRSYQGIAPQAGPEINDYRRMDTPAALEMHRLVRGLDDSAWIDMLVRSLEGSNVEGIQLPAFPTTDDVAWSMYPSAVEPEAIRRAGQFIDHLKLLVAANGLSLDCSTRVLDMGCGWGRLYRVLAKDVSPENLHGVDVDPWLIALCKATLPPEQFTSIDPHGYLPFPDESFDLIYANSVLSHLVATDHVAAVAEWGRMLAPGGILVATVLDKTVVDEVVANEGAADLVSWRKAVIDNIDPLRQGLAEKGFGWVSSGRRGESAGYGVAFLDPDWLRANWPAGIDLVAVERFDDDVLSFAVGRKAG